MRRLTILGLLLLMLRPAAAADWWAAPDGKPTGAGTQADPWDLATALRGGNNQKPQPGDTVYLRGGVYRGKFVGSLSGSPTAPITVRSAPGEWAVIDGFVTAALAAGLDATTKRVTLTGGTVFPNGSSVTVDREVIRLQEPVAGVYVNCLRGAGEFGAAPHNAGVEAVLGGNNLTVSGADAIYRDFEVTCSDPVRSQPEPNAQNAPRLRGEGVWLMGSRIQLVNLVLHDCQDGIFAADGALDSLVYGCLIYNNGYVAGGAHNGAGVYGQNTTGTKRFEELLVWNNFHYGLKQVSQTGNTVGMIHTGCVAWNTGSPMGTDARFWNLLVGTNKGLVGDVQVRQCHLYHPPKSDGGAPLNFGYTGGQGKGILTDSIIVGGESALEVNGWSDLTVTGNRVALQNPPRQMVLWRRYAGGSATWDGNDYVNGRAAGRGDSFFLPGSSMLTWDQWKAQAGVDANSTYLPGRPAAPWVTVRPNRFEVGRGHVVIYNWPLAATVPVNLSSLGLVTGQPYEVKNVQDWSGAPVLSGVYDAAAPVVNVPMTGTRVQAPIGWGITPKSTLPDFGAFLVRAVGPAKPPPVDPRITAAEAELRAWLGLYGPLESDPVFAARLGPVLNALRAWEAKP